MDLITKPASEKKKLSSEQCDWLDMSTHSIGMWYIENNVINVDGDFQCRRGKWKQLPVQFGIISGNFDCSNNSLTSLKGSPTQVGMSFICYNNNLTSLEYMPTKIGEGIECVGNPFVLNDKIFIDLAKIGKNKIRDYFSLMNYFFHRIHVEFRLNNIDIESAIFESYINILEGKTNVSH